jgi:hypothetical protein
MKGLFRWSDASPFAVFGFGCAIAEMVTRGFHWGYFTAAMWTVLFFVEHAMRCVSERESEGWKKIALTAHKAGALLVLAASGQRLVVTSPATGLTLEETQAAVDAICQVVTEVERATNEEAAVRS